MKIKFCGANHEVTGSCHLLKIKNKNILVDCGMFQGSDFNEGKNHDEFPFDPKEIDVVLVTHAHLDHTGRIPKLLREGFDGSIFMTKATCAFAKLIWEDAFGIMEYNEKKFQMPVLYSEADIEEAVKHCVGVDYHEDVDLGDGVSAVFKNMGHIFGSAFIEITDGEKKITFSGDVGNNNVPILKETENLSDVDVVICESTYGDRIHEPIEEGYATLLKFIQEGVKRGGTIMIPAFSLERTQQILFQLHKMSEHDDTLPKVPIYLDSPLAIEATKVYKLFPEYYDEEAMREYKAEGDFLEFPNLKITHTREESMAINDKKGPKIVIAGAGMMNGGRILHHAVRYLDDPNSTLIFVGYQAHGTLGRKLYEGAENVKVMGKYLEVKATIKAIGSLSAHGDQKKLMEWINSGDKKPEKVYLVHGEEHASTELSHRLRDEYGLKVFIPEYNEEVEIG